jgi:hypothetical protein
LAKGKGESGEKGKKTQRTSCFSLFPFFHFAFVTQESKPDTVDISTEKRANSRKESVAAESQVESAPAHCSKNRLTKYPAGVRQKEIEY